jgi:alkylation response protein AidB-like acyl-CoA dehydrogenase
MSEFPLYALSEEHQAIREAVRAVADAKIAPYAAAVDEEARYPHEAAAALLASDFHAPHVPEEYGGAGADALATVLVIEEVARACVSSSLIPAVNKLGSLPVQIAGSEELKQTYLTKLAKGEGGFSYCLSEPDAGSDAGGMKTRAVRDGDEWVLDGVKRWITNAGESEFYTVMAVTDAEKKTRGGISAFVVERSDEGVSFGAPEKKLGIKGSPTREVYLDKVRIPASRMIGEEGSGFTTAMKTLDHTRVTIAAQAVGVAQGALDYALGYAKERQQFGKSIADFQGLQFMLADMGMKIEAARQMTYAAAGRSERGDVLRLRRRDGGHRQRRAGPRRLRLHPRLPGRADDARRQDHPDLRGHQPGPADRDGTSAARWGAVRALTESRSGSPGQSGMMCCQGRVSSKRRPLISMTSISTTFHFSVATHGRSGTFSARCSSSSSSRRARPRRTTLVACSSTISSTSNATSGFITTPSSLEPSAVRNSRLRRPVAGSWSTA